MWQQYNSDAVDIVGVNNHRHTFRNGRKAVVRILDLLLIEEPNEILFLVFRGEAQLVLQPISQRKPLRLLDW